MNISLVGMMGCGKSTIGNILADIFPYFSFVDTDFLIVKKEKKSINDIFCEYGENYFRKVETEILKEVLSKNFQIISTGGGIVVSDENLVLLKQKSVVFYIKNSPEVLFRRVKNTNDRPLLNDSDVKSKIISLSQQRKNNYEKAHYIIEADNKSAIEIAEEIKGIVDGNCKS